MKTKLPIKKSKCKMTSQAIASAAAPAVITGLQTNWLDITFGVETAPVFGWRMESDERGAMQKNYRIIVSKNKSLKSPVWDSGKVASSVSAAIPYTGKDLESATRYWWGVEVQDGNGKTITSEPTFFDTGLIDKALWKGASWIMPAETDKKSFEKHPAMALRKIVKNAKAIRSAKWFVSGLGVFEAFINGKRITNLDAKGNELLDELKPGFTDARTLRQYFTYDVTHLVNKAAGAQNILAAVVTSGWWNDPVTGSLGKQNAFMGQMLITYTDGSKATIGTDKTWSAAFDGSVTKAEIFYGQDSDLRISDDWMTGAKLGEKWGKAVYNTEFNGRIESLIGPSIRCRYDMELAPVALTVLDAKNFTGVGEDRYGVATVLRTYAPGDEIKLNPGEVLIADMAQNAAGRERVTVTGKSGTTVTIRHCEMLNDKEGLKSRGNDNAEGMPYYENLRKARATSQYILSGKENELCRPLYSFYGYRYITITTTKAITIGEIASEIINSIPVGSDTAELTTSNELINRLIKNCRWGHYSNYLSVPTDCPQRDERNGWTADTQVFAPAASYDATAYGFLAKFMRDMRDAQGPEGAFTSVAPSGFFGRERMKVGWADAAIVIPHVMWRFYGDTTIIEDNIESLSKYIDLIYQTRGPIPLYGDWLAYEKNDIELQYLLCAAYYVWDTQMLAEMTGALKEAIIARTGGDPKKLAAYTSKLKHPEGWDFKEHFTAINKIARDYFQYFYLDKNGLVKPHYACQTAYLYTLMLNLNPTEESRKATIKALVDNIESHGTRLQTGFLGTTILLDTLTACGEVELAYKLLLQEKEPSWLYSVLQGATTIWERWNSYTKDAGFGSSGMNSFNHYAYGAVLAWMMNTMAGIRYDSEKPGFQHFILSPIPNQLIQKVDGAYRTPYGKVKSAWSYSGNNWSYEATIPANSTALVKLVCPKGKRLTVNGKAPKALSLALDGIVFREKVGDTYLFDAVATHFTASVK